MTSNRVDQTLRQQIVTRLSEETLSTRDLSKMLGIPEREVHDHLAHITRSLLPKKKKLVILPCRCLKCGYVFGSRNRFTRPSRCPRCRGERIREPRFQVT